MAALQQSLRDLSRAFAEELQPAGTAAVRQAYETLAAAFQPKGSGDPAKRVLLWVDTFKDWPLCALNDAVRRWSVKDTAFMPTPGQFHACGEAEIEKRRADLIDVRRVLRIMDKPETDDFAVEPIVIEKFARLRQALKNGENLRALIDRGELRVR